MKVTGSIEIAPPPDPEVDSYVTDNLDGVVRSTTPDGRRFVLVEVDGAIRWGKVPPLVSLAAEPQPQAEGKKGKR